MIVLPVTCSKVLQPHENALSQPVCSDSVPGDLFKSTHPHEKALSQPVSTLLKWKKYAAVVNANRRQLYKANPFMKRYKSLLYYYSQPNIKMLGKTTIRTILRMLNTTI